MGCHVNCSSFPHYVQTDNDISGIGVVVGFVVTAAFAVVIIIAYYLFAFRPELDPFRNRDGSADPHRALPHHANPIDVYVLRSISRVTRHRLPTDEVMDKVENSLVRCVLAMSDIQILTGLAILVSGYSQLCNGILCCNWQIVIYLAWFSSLTHLTCLTLLRNFLHLNPFQRVWRLGGMFLIVVLLVTAVGSTGNYDFDQNDDSNPLGDVDWTRAKTESEWAFIERYWPKSSPYPSSYAKCHFYSTPTLGDGNPVILSAIVSILLISVSFLSRVIKAFESLDVSAVGRATDVVSKWARRQLASLHVYASHQKKRVPVFRTLLYWPLLMLFLLLRIGADSIASFTMEVWLLIVSFSWGVIRLTAGLNQCGAGSQAWTFGQVLPVFLLLAPLLTFWELIATDEAARLEMKDLQEMQARNTQAVGQSRRQSITHGTSGTHTRNAYLERVRSRRDSAGLLAIHDDPFEDFYAHSPFLDDTVAFIFLVVAEVSVQLLVYEGQDLNAWVFFGFRTNLVYNWLPINMGIWFYNFLLMRYTLQLSLDRHVRDQRLGVIIRFGFLAIVFGLWVTQNFHDLDSKGTLSLVVAPLGGYYLLWILYHCLEAIYPGDEQQ